MVTGDRQRDKTKPNDKEQIGGYEVETDVIPFVVVGYEKEREKGGWGSGGGTKSTTRRGSVGRGMNTTAKRAAGRGCDGLTGSRDRYGTRAQRKAKERHSTCAAAFGGWCECVDEMAGGEHCPIGKVNNDSQRPRSRHPTAPRALRQKSGDVTGSKRALHNHLGLI
jgi:hypothetical protein